MVSKSIAIKALVGALITPLIFGVPLFLSAGTVEYWEGWLFLCVFSIATGIHTVFLLKTDPALLERRMRAGPTAEKRPAQRLIMVFILASFFLLLIVSGIDHRYAWSHVPAWLVIAGDLVIALSYVDFYLVLRENTFASATIELAEGQKVVSTGPYAIVRHPMYAGALPMMIGIPLALGSLWGLLAVAVALPVLHCRIVDEEKFLKENLEGYSEYCSKVKYRLLPGVY